MATLPNGNQRVRFGIFEVDLKAGELRRNGSRVRLQDQPFQILTMLLEHPGEVVTREELRGRLWAADTYVDFDHGLNAAVRRLRDALGDTAENPRFVETVARRGYRLLAPVNGAVATSSTTAGLSAATSTNRWRVLAVAILLLLGVAAGWWAGSRHHLPQIQQRRLTANPEEDPVLGSAISPDGKYLAFADSTGFYLRQTDTGETHALSLPNGFAPVPASWYPDGTHLIASWVEGPTAPSSLWQLSIMGGAPRKLIDDGRLAAASPDGSKIAFIRGPKPTEEIWVMEANGDQPRRLVSSKGQMFGVPAWSPDGRRIAYVVSTYTAEHWQVDTTIGFVDLTSGEEGTIFSPSSYRAAISADMELGPALVWTRDNHLIYSASELPPNQNDSNVWSVQLDSHGHVAGNAQRLTATPDEVSGLSGSSDGKRIALTKNSLTPGVYVADVRSGGTRLSSPRRLTLDNWRDYPFSWTPDSKAVLFASDRDGPYHIFKQRIDQTAPELLVGGNEEAMLPRLAPDNSAVLFVIWPKLGEATAPRRLMRVPVGGGPQQAVLQHAGMGNMQCARAPSTLCLFDSRSSGRLSFFRFDPVTGTNEEMQQIRIQDEVPFAYNWTLSPDGKILAVAKGKAMQKDPSITFYSIDDGSKHTVTAQAWAGISSIDFAADGHSLWAPAFTNNGKWALLNIDFQGRTTTVLEDTNMTIGWAIASPDGRHLALWQSRGNSNVWMLERF